LAAFYWKSGEKEKALQVAEEGLLKGQHSIRINDQRRICFLWREDGVHNVEIVDYH
jgi:plasmid maintenance system killer protein